VMMPPRAQAHVDALDAQGATVALEEGTVEVSVVHRAHTRWEIRAGRYQIRVTGTKFSAGWDAQSQSLTVTMREGSVEVTGPGLRAPARVVTGQRLRTSGAAAKQTDEPEVVVEDANTIAARQEEQAPPAQPDKIEAPEAPVAVEAALPEIPPAKTISSAPVASERRGGSRARQQHVAPAPPKLAMADAEWRGLEARGKFKDALASVLRDADWDESCQRLGSEDLLKLGDLARTGGRPDLAETAYRAANHRFEQADRAPYLLGKLAFDQRKDYPTAARWFRSYVKRFPQGALAHEAVGLWLESSEKAGDNAGARDAAAAYLEIFPKGPKASQARALRD
jgi:transmembrane sensor